MTRDQAIKIKLNQNDKLIEIGNLTNQQAAEHQIDTWVALGMLKLDEPRNAAAGKFTDVYLQADCANGISAFEFLDRLSAAGLKIVEK